MFGGEALTGSTHKSGMDRPDAVSQNAALGNPSAAFKWKFVQNLPDRLDVEVVRERWNKGREPDDQTQAFTRTVVSGIALLGTQNHYRYEREETPNEIRARMQVDTKEWSENSYHSAVLRSPENHRWVTAMDIAIGQAKCLDDPDMREVLVAIADWKITKKRFDKISRMKGWSRLGAETQAIVDASYKYYDKGKFPSDDLVSLVPPTLVSALSKQGDDQ